MVFSEITSEAIRNAIEHTRALRHHLVEAQETRRVLDRLYGYTLSPLLWKKIARGLSAGRVQSVAVRLLVQRELERLAFHRGTFWDLKARLAVTDLAPPPQSAEGSSTPQPEFDADLDYRWPAASCAAERILTKRPAGSKSERRRRSAHRRPKPHAAARRDRGGPWTVADLEQRSQTRRPAPPFTTSTLQQEANRKLGIGQRHDADCAAPVRRRHHHLYAYRQREPVERSDQCGPPLRARTLGDAYLEPS